MKKAMDSLVFKYQFYYAIRVSRKKTNLTYFFEAAALNNRVSKIYVQKKLRFTDCVYAIKKG